MKNVTKRSPRRSGRPTHIPTKGVKIQNFLDGHYSQIRDVRPSTLDQYAWVVRSFSKHLGRPAKLTDLNPEAINSWLAFISQHLSPYTVHGRRMTILSLWSAAYQLNLASQPEPRQIRRIKKPDRVVRVLTAQQVKLLITLTDGLTGTYCGLPKSHYVRSFLRATFETALRQSDLHRLQWADVLASGGRLNIIQQKTGHRRAVRLSHELLTAIGKWHPPAGLIWPRPQGRDTIGRLITRLGNSINVPGLTHTKLRQTAITNVERQRPGAGWIFAGHTSPTTTRRWYTDNDLVADELPGPNFDLGY